MRPPASGGLGQLAHACRPGCRHVSLRRLLCDLIEEYGQPLANVGTESSEIPGRRMLPEPPLYAVCRLL